jgi:hypothetical protein
MQADPDVQDVIEKELRLLDPAVRQSRDTAAELLDPDFREFGVSVRVWDRGPRSTCWPWTTRHRDGLHGHDVGRRRRPPHLPQQAR